MNMYLDCDTTPAIRSQFTRGKLESTIRQAKELLVEHDAEGQIGIFENSRGDGFAGYVIRYVGQEPYFEKAEGE
jgi:hypothetical protein